jgi:hypothetical protein
MTTPSDLIAREEKRFASNISLPRISWSCTPGNHSPCHPLTALVEAARRLSHRKDIVFCFVGGGSEQQKVKDFARQNNLANILCLPYQPFATLSASLSAGDLHAVVMGNEFVGIVHPCKLYNILAIGTPFLYIGPTPSHISEIVSEIRSSQVGSLRVYSAASEDVETVVESILEAAKRKSDGVQDGLADFANIFSKQTLLPGIIKVLQSEASADNQVFTASERSSIMSGGH